ncbi:SDR family oxidoreductase [Arthrobacter sp. zg-Y1110]|uniref:SDR family oxidoreductase n=1 Tax=Arthrobacter sp. zg-Y1110 TaxID=2886932 RepID=UPI001D15C71D|nr:SDR family oxidoreductase [Arthrobacter sp. zg-Y1110]MCC3291372.1 SDR family oxidoreductase [Arthrobacter sp. zg-Y1110]UWX83790.1 SDR family oxidoreductase [Arthrobacter sp. zg-Y1110]
MTETVALVTGANRGLGREFVAQLVERGARKIYATTRQPGKVSLLEQLGAPGQVEALVVDITDPATVEAAAAAAADVNLLINNAGIATATNLLTGDVGRIRAEMDTHFWGTLDMTRAFAPVLASNGGGTIMNVMSLLSFRSYPGNGAYAAAKAAEWQLTNSTRLELADQGTHVMGVHLSSTDTDMMKGWDIPKNDPRVIISDVLDALVKGSHEFLDADTQAVKDQLSLPPEAFYAGMGPFA